MSHIESRVLAHQEKSKMKSFLRKTKILLFTTSLLILLSFPISAAEVTLTIQNMPELTSKKPVLAYTSLNCDLGRSAADSFREAFSDLRGMDISIVDTNKDAYKIFGGFYNYGLGTMVLLKDGKVLESSDSYIEKKEGYYEPALVGNNQKRVWLSQMIEKHKLNASLNASPVDRAEPYLFDTTLDLTKGAIGFFNFKNGLKDTGTPNGKSFQIRGTDFRLLDDAIFGTGKYKSNSNASFSSQWTNPAGIRSGVTIFMDFNLNSEGKTACMDAIFSTLDRQISFGTYRGKLFISLQVWNGNKNWGDVYYLTETNIKLNEWNNLGFSLDPKNKRAYVQLNGVRLKDLVLTDPYITSLNQQKGSPYFNFELVHFGCGSVLSGFADRIAIYERVLGAKEMKAFFEERSRKGTGKITPIQTLDISRLNKEFVSYAKDGNLNNLKIAISKGADVNYQHEGWTALMFAAYYGHTSIVKELIKNRINPLVEISGYTAQKLAEFQNHSEIQKLLEDYSNTESFYFQRKMNFSVNQKSSPMPPI